MSVDATEQPQKPKKDRREYMRQLYARKREHFRETGRKRQAAWRKKNREKARATQKRANDSEKGIARRERFRKKRPTAPYEAHRKFALKRRYNITPEQWDAMFAAQGATCANRACGVVDPGKAGWHTDHCHATGQLRAILCRPCNMTLGAAKDSAVLLRGLADYLEEHSNRRGDGPKCLTLPTGWKRNLARKKSQTETATC